MHTIGFKSVQRWYIRGWGVSKQVVCLILTLFMLKLQSKSDDVDEVWSKLKEAEGVV